jgi:acyl-CoA synthetase (NDP forming)
MTDRVDEIVQNALREGRSALLEPEAKRICNEYQIRTPASRLVSSSSEAVKAAKSLGFPVVLKIVSPDIPHKTEAKCVILNLRNGTEVKRSFSEIIDNARHHATNATIRGILVEKMLAPGTEVIVGSLREPGLGQAVMFGLGGVFVEVFEDVSFRLAPLREHDARSMIREIKGYEILKGHRKQEPADEESLVKIILSVSRLVRDHAEISEMDLNPTVVYRKGAIVADARMSLGR